MSDGRCLSVASSNMAKKVILDAEEELPKFENIRNLAQTKLKTAEEEMKQCERKTKLAKGWKS